jgi:hypothetical protein
MKLNFKLFGLEVTIHREGYWVCVSSEREIDPCLCQAWDFAFTYWGARFKAWRLARMYAKYEGLDQSILVYRATDYGGQGSLIWWGTLKVRKVVDFFSTK